jgi:hypothetical protein
MGMKLIFCILLVYSLQCLGLFNKFSFESKSNIKKKLIEESRRVQKGLTETTSDRDYISSLVQKLEGMNSSKEPLKDPNLNATWNLEYTTSSAVLGKNGFKRVGPTLQVIDTKNLLAENIETISVFGIKIEQKVKAELKPLSKSKVAVQFKTFYIGPLSFKAPESAKGTLDTTYLDNDFRISRGDKGNLFVLTR